MASRLRSLSRPSVSLVKSCFSKPNLSESPMSALLANRSSVALRPIPQLGCLQSLLPLHSAVSAARLTSCLGIDSTSSRSLSQELGLSVPR